MYPESMLFPKCQIQIWTWQCAPCPSKMYVSAESNSCQNDGSYMNLQALHAGQLHCWTEYVSSNQETSHHILIVDSVKVSRLRKKKTQRIPRLPLELSRIGPWAMCGTNAILNGNGLKGQSSTPQARILWD